MNSEGDDLSWLPEQATLTRSELTDVMLSLRALLTGTRADEPLRAPVLTIALMVTRAMEREGGQE